MNDWKDSKGHTPIALAALHGHEEAVQLFLTLGADPNASNKEEESPLMFAAKSQKLSIVRNLLDFGANVNQRSRNGLTALHHAFQFKSSATSIVAELVARGADIEAKDCYGVTPVYKASLEGFPTALKILLEKAKETGCLQSLINTGASSGSWTPLIIAAARGKHECVNLLLQNGADCNNTPPGGWSALHSASLYGNFSCAKLLLDRMDHTVWQYLDDKITRRNSVGQHFSPSPLHLAIDYRRHDIVQLILNYGVDPDAIPYIKENCLSEPWEGSTPEPHMYMPPLALAAYTGCIEDIEALLDSEADINPMAANNHRPILVAVYWGRKLAVELLLKRGANPNHGGCERLLIWSMIEAEILQLLLKYGADVSLALDQNFSNSIKSNERPMAQGVRLEILRKNIAVLQMFITPAMLEPFIARMYPKVFSEEEELNWKEIFRNSRKLPALKHLCRIQIRQCLMDNGSDEFPFSKRLEKLHTLPAAVNRYLAYN